ncbi:MAG: type III-A CRISPR-associated RAMP protein Csm5 [Clostridia bacterium]|nr:type III-A CRISPR-associated RAMP protein Csm5 [Clostridia bacterium]
MKYAHLERFKVTLSILSPVYIGSSSQEKLSNKECAVDTRAGVVYVPDVQKLVETIDEKGRMKDFEAFLQNNVANKGIQSLFQFLQSMSIPISPKEKWVSYVLQVGSREITTVNTLSRFVKNAEGMPYIPGSSIKGAIRTALLAEKMSQKDVDTVIEDGRRYPKGRRPGPEENLLRVLRMNTRPNKEQDAVNDLLRTLEISDSAPFRGEALTVCKKLEFDSDGEIRGNAEGNRRGRTSPPLFRECLIPGQQTQFYMTLDTRLTNAPLSVQQIKKALDDWDKIQREYAQEFYIDDIKLDLSSKQGIPITLGGGVGFQSKSLIYKHAEKKVIREAVEYVLSTQFPRTYKPKYTNDPAPYRLKIATYKGRYYQMGRCSIQVEGT